MKRFIIIGLIAGTIGGLVIGSRDVVMQVGWVLNKPLWYLALASCLTIVAPIIGAVIGGVLGALSLVLLVVIKPRTEKLALPDLQVWVALTMTGAAPLLLLTYSPGLIEGWAELMLLSLVGLTAYLIMRPAAQQATISELCAGAVGILASEAFFLVGCRLPEQGLLPIHPLSYMLAAGIGIALGCLFYRIVTSLLATLAGRYGERGSVYILVGVLAVLVVGLTGSGTITQTVQFFPVGKLLSAKTVAERPNLILISVCSLRADFLGYHAGRAKTPVIDELSSKSYIFERAYSVAPCTRPSFAACFSGRYPSEMGVARTSEAEDLAGKPPLMWRQDRDLLAEVWKNAGYTTMAVVTNCNLTEETHADQGFDHFYHCGHGEHVRRLHTSVVTSLARVISRSPSGQLAAPPGIDEMERAKVVSTKAQQVIRSFHSSPGLIWLQYVDPHTPYDPPSLPEDQRVYGYRLLMTRTGSTMSTIQNSFINAYTAEIEYLDHWLGEVIATLKAEKLWDSSVIVFWGDHGEEFWEHGGFEHGHSLYNELLHVPLLIHLPGQAESKRIKQPVTLLDVMPTLLELYDLKGPDGLRERSLVPVLKEGRGELEPLQAYLEGCISGDIRKGLLTDRYKLVYNVDRDSFSLYDQHNDPGEQHNIYGTPLAPDTRAMEEKLLEWTDLSLATMNEYVRTRRVEEPSPEIRERLKDMGYIQ